jgi:hypothetical protein
LAGSVRFSSTRDRAKARSTAVATNPTTIRREVGGVDAPVVRCPPTLGILVLRNCMVGNVVGGLR